MTVATGAAAPRSALAYHRLEQDFVSGAVEPDRTYALSELEARYGVGTTPMKEAVQRAAADGLLQILPRRGVRVRDVPFDELEPLLTARRPLEMLIVRLVARGASTDERAGLAAVSAEVLTSALAGNAARTLDADGRLKQAALAATHEPIVETAARPVFSHFRRLYWRLGLMPDLAISRAIARPYRLAAEWREDEALAAMRDALDLIEGTVRAAATRERPGSGTGPEFGPEMGG